MPIYEYRCKECETVFEKLVRSNSDEKIECPDCNSTQTEKQISTFSNNCANPTAGYSSGGGHGFG